jgi:hypothetical protein
LGKAAPKGRLSFVRSGLGNPKMPDIWDTAIARGIVLEGSQLLVIALAPFAEQALASIYDTSVTEAINKEIRRDPDLRPDVRKWGLDELHNVINFHWQKPNRNAPSFYNYFRYTRQVRNVNLLKDGIDDARIGRDCAAHPEFLLIEDGQKFFTASDTVLRLLGLITVADEFRRYLNELSTIIAGEFRNRTLLEERYPKEYEEDFKNAEELWISGTNLRRIVTDQKLDEVRQVLGRENGSVKVLMHRPRYTAACKFAMIQEGLEEQDFVEYCVDVRDNLLKFFNLRAEKEVGKKLEIKTINYMLAFGLDVMNGTHNGAGGAVYLRMYPLPRRGIKKFEDQPIVKFQPNDRRWYQFFKDQFTYHWEHESAQELPLDWDPRHELDHLKST